MNSFFFDEDATCRRIEQQAFVLKPAHAAQQEAVALAEKYASSIKPPWSGFDRWHAHYGVMLAELIVPRAITAVEIRSIRFPPQRRRAAHREHTEHLRQEDYMYERLGRSGGADFNLL